MNKNSIFIIIVLLICTVFFVSAYVVDEREQVIITQFGRKIGDPITKSGLKFKAPFIQKVNRFPKNILEWDGEKGELPTSNKTYIWVDTFARWRISDPYLFFQRCKNVRGALIRIGDIINPAIKNAVASYPLIETVRNTNRKMDMLNEDLLENEQAKTDSEVVTGRSKIMHQILLAARAKLSDMGIDLIDVKVKQLNYRDDVRESVYDRMIAERTQIVEKLRSQGRGEAQKILGDKDKELKKITSNAYKEAQKIKGDADAQATRIFGEAFSQDPEFYAFIKTLEVYNSAFDDKSALILSTDSEFLKYMKSVQ